MKQNEKIGMHTEEIKSDAALEQDVLDELAWEPRVDESKLGVGARQGIVTLTGHLNSHAEKLAARRAILRIAGVKGVALDVEVELPEAQRRSDSEIASAASMAPRWHPSVPRDAVKLSVDDGVITLTGEVAAPYQREASEKAVRSLVGVKAVENRVIVKPNLLPKDVKSRIAAALHRQAQIDVERISVSIEDHQVTLAGTVASWEERKAALRAAWAAPGITRVVDAMTIRP